jgi:multidrug resistance efflux pump
MSHPSAPRRRWLSFVCLLGVACLALSMVGAGWMLRNNAGPSAAASRGGEDTAPALLRCLGHVDVQGGLSYPYPLRPGRVAEVKVHEGQAVKKDDVLFLMDGTFERQDVAIAEQALTSAAEQAAAKARIARQKHGALVEAQTQAVEAARRKRQQAEIVAAHKRELVQKKALAPVDADVADKQVEEAAAAVKAQEATLEALRRDAEEITRAEKEANDGVARARLLRDKAQLALDQCAVKAPEDGLVLRLDVHAGDTLGPQPKAPPLIFCPANSSRVVRAEVEQEWAGLVQRDQVATIQDETSSGTGPTWKGKVTGVSEWMASRRSVLPDPSQHFDVRTLECIVTLDPGQPPLRIGQRVRVALRNP